VQLLDALREVTQALAAERVPYALVGGLALAVHGVQRATADIDLLVLESDLDRVYAAVEPLGFRFRAHPLSFADGTELRRVTRVEGKQAVTLDLLLAVGPLQPLWGQREERAADWGPLSVISRDGLIAMKTLAGRPQDLADLSKLAEDDR
jgi:hypothetical protein